MGPRNPQLSKNQKRSITFFLGQPLLVQLGIQAEVFMRQRYHFLNPYSTIDWHLLLASGEFDTFIYQLPSCKSPPPSYQRPPALGLLAGFTSPGADTVFLGTVEGLFFFLSASVLCALSLTEHIWIERMY